MVLKDPIRELDETDADYHKNNDKLVGVYSVDVIGDMQAAKRRVTHAYKQKLPPKEWRIVKKISMFLRRYKSSE